MNQLKLSAKIALQLRSMPVDAVILGLVGLGILSWTQQVNHFRLGVPGFYEHIFAYGLFGATLLACKASTRLTVLELVFIIVMISCLEASKVGIVDRHPKTSDFIADMLGVTISLGLAYMIHHMIRLVVRLFKISMKPHCRP